MNRVSLAAFAAFLACPALGATPAEVEQRIRQFQQGLARPVLISGETPAFQPPGGSHEGARNAGPQHRGDSPRPHRLGARIRPHPH